MKIIQIGIIILGYAATFLTSGLVVKYFLLRVVKRAGEDDGSQPQGRSASRLGSLIGKCENFLTVTLILVDAYTALALIFTAKSIVRIDAIKKNPEYYLGGTLVNFSYSVLMGCLIQAILSLIGCPLAGKP